VRESPMSRVFEWDFASPQAFWRQFLSGIFIVIVMTGLDQDMMQKNLTCRTLRDAQKDMCLYGMAFLPINALLLALGILLYTFCAAQGIALPAKPDALLPQLVSSGALGPWVVIPFSLGIVAAAFSAADGALTALTTSCCIDLLEREDDVRLRRRVHALMVLACLGCVWIFAAVDSPNVINTIYVMASYTYGPLLGLFAFGLFTRVRVRDRFVPWVVVLSPLICGVLDRMAPVWWNYKFGYELLVFNGLLTAVGLFLLRAHNERVQN
jgi:sodium:solute symporter family protein